MTAGIKAPLRIRAAAPSDIVTLVDFNLAMALETEGKTLDRAVLTAGVEAVFSKPEHGFYLIAETNGVVAGCLMVTYEWSDWRNGQWWWLQSVYVPPEQRRNGVFRALYLEVERRARAASGVIGVRLYVDHDNAKAQGVYASFGMECTNYRLYEILFA